MSGYTKFDTERYSEELFGVAESEHDEVMRLMAADDFAGYGEWSSQLESETSWSATGAFITSQSRSHKAEWGA